MLTRNGCDSLRSKLFSFITDSMDFFRIILVLSISFMAYTLDDFLSRTFHTLPNPPFPATNLS